MASAATDELTNARARRREAMNFIKEGGEREDAPPAAIRASLKNHGHSEPDSNAG
ncbi:hypothetical protein BGE01nite_35680 [Brevifollis gellanilyticus]|uniref:Uncharacterized protein n=1 Tax=Brevifollis gellanilyticus TaxID=748831 RepID=A0A512MC16_9BACT|nr:hypothetical protein BGE01nite_35680 [Brevifollis gellanilyticus]